ncbi:MAG: formimidoylglutamase [Erysipelotrichales bacterium]
MIGYKKANLSIWQGRVDSESDYDSFLWHQHIQLLDMSLSLPIKDNKFKFVLIGYEVDEGISLNKGRKGAQEGPEKVIDFLRNKPCSFAKEVLLFDGGRIRLETSVEDAQATLSKVVFKCLDNGYFPIVIGGGHDVAYGTMSGVLKKYPANKNKLGLINFDAHFDMRPYKYSTSGTMFRQIYDDINNQDGKFNHLTIGIQRSSTSRALFKYAKEINSEYVLAVDLLDQPQAARKRLLNFIDNQEYIYVSVCADVFSSPYAPGVSSPQPLGIHPEKFLRLLIYIIKSKKMVAFDIAEIAPPLDASNATASLGGLIIYSLINTLVNE